MHKSNLFKIEQNTIMRIAGICGILIPIIIFAFLGFAMVDAQWFDWTQHALSDLGVEENSALFFNSGMMLGGILTFIFSIGLIKLLSNKTGAYALCLSSLALMGIGIFPMTFFTLHFIVSSAFFILLVSSLFIMGATIKQNKFEKNMANLSTFFASLAMFSIFLLIPLKGVAISESMSCFPAFVLCMIYGLKMIFFGKSN